MQTVTEQPPPRNSLGQIMAKKCLDCGGDLHFENTWGYARWRCGKLLDPGHKNLPLKVCTFFLYAGVNDD